MPLAYKFIAANLQNINNEIFCHCIFAIKLHFQDIFNDNYICEPLIIGIY